MFDTTGSDESEDAATVQVNPAAMAALLADLEPTEDSATVMFSSLNLDEIMGESVLVHEDEPDETSFETPRPPTPRDPFAGIDMCLEPQAAHSSNSAQRAASHLPAPKASPPVELAPPPSMRHNPSQPAAQEELYVPRPRPNRAATPTRDAQKPKTKSTGSSGGSLRSGTTEFPAAAWAGAGVCAALAMGVLFYIFV